jgi:hypothetical protein
MTRFLLVCDSCEFVDVGRSLWREDGSVVYNCCRPSPAQSFSGPSPVGLATIFCCLRFETSLFVASFDSQGYGWGIWPPSTRDSSRSHECTASYNLHTAQIEVAKPKGSITVFHESTLSESISASNGLVLWVLSVVTRSRDSSVGIATCYGLDDRGVGVRVPVRSRIFSTSSRTALGFTQLPSQWVPVVLLRG